MIKRPALRTVVRGAAVALCATACAVALAACGGEQAPTQEEAAPQEEAAEAEPEGPEPVAHTNDLYDLVAIEEAGPEAYEQNIVSKLMPHTNPDLQGGWDGIVVDDPTFIDGITLTDSMINYDDEYNDGSCQISLRFDGDVEGNIDAIANEILIRTSLANSGTIYADPDSD